MTETKVGESNQLVIAPSSPVLTGTTLPPVAKTPQEIHKEISDRIKERFWVMHQMTDAVILGTARSLIVSGPPGLGKSYEIQEKLSLADPNGDNHIISKGHIRATGLYKLLYKYREAGQVVVLDDSDYIFGEDVALGILKAVCDTTKRRVVAWRTQAKLKDEDTFDDIPKSFEYNGGLIFLTNLDFHRMIAADNKFSVHLSALKSRSHYIDLELKSQLDYMIRIKTIISEGKILAGIPPEEQNEIWRYITSNRARLEELSLRTVVKLRDLQIAHPNSWKRIANITICR
jgi:hypothetical protein